MNAIEKALATRANNFDVLRLIAALMVVVSHGYHTYGTAVDPWTRLTGFKTLGAIGVAIFFVMSGFLVARSYEFDPSPIRFAWKRFLRIMPGLLVCALFTVFLLGPCVTSLSLEAYLGHSGVYRYLIRMLLLVKPPMTLPGVFECNPITSAVNGSLWTLQYEVGLYILLMACGMLRMLSKRWFVICMCGCFVIGHWHLSESAALLRLGDTLGSVFYLGFLFFSGVLFWVCRGQVILSWKAFVLSIALQLGALETPFFPLIFMLTLPYLVIFTALIPCRMFQKIGEYGDYSYGFYIYAFPIQQVVVQYCKPLGLSLFSIIFISLFVICVVAILSWWLVEKPCLRLKRAIT